MEQTILEQKTKHFHQALHTPVAQQGNIFKVPHIIHPRDINKSTVPDTSEGLRKFFLWDPNTPEIQTDITREEFTMGIKNEKKKQAHHPCNNI